MASMAPPLSFQHWDQSFNASRLVNGEGQVNAHPTSVNPPEQHRSFTCAGCCTLREGNLVAESQLDQKLNLTYPWMLISTKIAILINEAITDAEFMHRSTILGYMCQGCAFFHKLTGFIVRRTIDQSVQDFTIQRIFIVRNGEAVIENVSGDPLTYLQHLKDNPSYAALCRFEGNIPRIIQDNEFKTLAQLANYATNQAARSS